MQRILNLCYTCQEHDLCYKIDVGAGRLEEVSNGTSLNCVFLQIQSQEEDKDEESINSFSWIQFDSDDGKQLWFVLILLVS